MLARFAALTARSCGLARGLPGDPHETSATRGRFRGGIPPQLSVQFAADYEAAAQLICAQRCNCDRHRQIAPIRTFISICGNCNGPPLSLEIRVILNEFVIRISGRRPTESFEHMSRCRANHLEFLIMKSRRLKQGFRARTFRLVQGMGRSRPLLQRNLSRCAILG